MYGRCDICDKAEWQEVYTGPIRAGAFGNIRNDGEVKACGHCGVWRLREDCAMQTQAYETESYRAAVGQGLDVQSFFGHHDAHQIYNLSGVGSEGLRGATVADVGCAAGSFLDFVSGVCKRVIAIEPTPIYHASLRSRGYGVYSFASEALAAEAGKVDLVTSFQVIEHVENPRRFLEELSQLLSPAGRIVIATPNRRDILLNLLPVNFQAFYFRCAHRWYFDMASLKHCAGLAGLTTSREQFAHTMGISNAFTWLRDRKPTGNARLDGLSETADKLWSAYLEQTGQADTLYVTLQRR